MTLTKNEQKEWTSVKAKANRNRIRVKRNDIGMVFFPYGVVAQLGTGRATEIIDALIWEKRKLELKMRRLKKEKKNLI